MKKITKEEMIKILSKNYLQNILTLEDLEYLDTVSFVGDSSNDYFIEYTFNEKKLYELSTINESFVNECINYIKNQKIKNFELFINDDKYENLIVKELNINIKEKSKRGFLSYRCDDDVSLVDSKIDSKLNSEYKIKVLKLEDKELIKDFNPKVPDFRPSFDILFTTFVEKESGKVAILLKDNNIVGYISYYELTEDIYNIDYIYIIEENRNQGLAPLLIREYAIDVLSKGKTPYYGPAINKYSTRASIKAGFTLLKEDYKYEVEYK